jgi:DNA-binding GntR family transcriptional regulator
MPTPDRPTPGPAPELDKRRAADQAYDRMEGLIATLALRPGAPVVEADLIESTGLGRTPVREALMRLAAQGLLVQLPRRGLLVSDLNVAEHLDLLEARRALEQLLAASAARRGTPPQKAQLLHHAQEMGAAAQAEALEAFMQADQAFDRLYHAAARNRAAASAVAPMALQCRRFWYAYQHQADMKTAAAFHLALAQAVAQSEPERAVEAAGHMMDYLRLFTQRVLA